MKTTFLFLCTGNSCRSQMTEGWAHHLKGDVVIVFRPLVETFLLVGQLKWRCYVN